MNHQNVRKAGDQSNYIDMVLPGYLIFNLSNLCYTVQMEGPWKK